MTAPVREELVVPGLPPAPAHYADAVRFGDLLFVSGVVALDESGGVVGGDVRAQARRVHELLGAVLAHAGASFADVLKVTVFLTDIADLQAVTDVRKEFFGDARPASTLVAVAALAVPGASRDRGGRRDPVVTGLTPRRGPRRTGPLSSCQVGPMSQLNTTRDGGS